MAKELNITPFLKDIFPQLLLLRGSKDLVIAELNKMPMTSVQKIDIMMQWLEAFNMKLTFDIAEKLRV